MTNNKATRLGRVLYRHNNLIAAILSILILFPDVILGFRSLDPSQIYKGKNFVDAEFMYHSNMTIDTTARPSLHVELATPVYYESPLDKFLGRALRDGDFAFWNPYAGLGMPVLEQYSTRALFPLQILENFLLLDDRSHFNLFVILLTIYFFLLAARTLRKMTFLESLALGVFIGGSAIFCWFLGLRQMQNVFFATSIAVFLLLRFPPDNSRGIAANALGIGHLHLAGQPEASLFVLILMFFVTIFHKEISVLKDVFTVWLKRALGLMSSSVLGLLIAGPQVFPFVYGVISSAVDNSLHGFDGGAGMASPPPLTLLRLIVSPALSSYPLSVTFYPVNGHWDAVGFFSGLITVMLLLLFVMMPSKSTTRLMRVTFFLLVGFVVMMVCKNFGIDPFYQLGKLPLINLAWSPRWSNVAIQTAIVLALTISFDIKYNSAKSSRLRFLFVAAVCSILAVESLRVIPTDIFIHGFHYGEMHHNPEFHLPNIIIPTLAPLFPAVILGIHTFRKGFSFEVYKKLLLALILIQVIVMPRVLSAEYQMVLMLSLSFLLIAVLISKKYRFALILAPTCVLFVGIAHHQNTKPVKLPFDENNLINFVKENTSESDRVLFRGPFLYGNSGSEFHIRNLAGVFSLPIHSSHKALSLIDKQEIGSHNWVPWYVAPNIFKLYANRFVMDKSPKLEIALLNAYSFRWIVCETSNVECRAFRPIVDNPEGFTIYENISALPRIGLKTKNASVIHDVSETLNSIRVDGCFVDGDKVIVRDAFFPGWTVQTEPANKIVEIGPHLEQFRAVTIGEDFCGKIEQYYTPRYWAAYVFISTITLLLCVLFVFLGRKEKSSQLV
jgi:hypothetical protein